MHFHKPTSETYVFDGASEAEALRRTTHLGIAAHQDDIEIMALEGILACFGSEDKWFSCAIVTDGGGSARDGIYADFTDAGMMQIRRLEQKKAAFIGEYSACAFLDYPSREIKDPSQPGPVADIHALLEACSPQVVYLHNLCDKHDTHVAVTLRAIAALRQLPAARRPRKLYGCEVWRDLDWLNDADKVVFNCSGHENVAAALLGVFDSQIAGGKRYDLATLGRRRANATYFQSHSVDAAGQINFGMDLTPLLEDDSIHPLDFAAAHIRRFEQDVRERLSKLG
ncbi:MAG: PIG-L family deacetylase [Candidatus Solibacter usitatus]|nr:PIG-L family deacetylase [Candidatus Solibacter usitatus]